MKTLQNNFTTPEQSNRLLELGVPVDSADCMNFGNADIFQIPFQRPFSEHLELHVPEGLKKMYTPCWSVGRLMEIILIAFKKHYFAPKELLITLDTLNRSLLEDAISKIEELKEVYDIDFSKLEE